MKVRSLCCSYFGYKCKVRGIDPQSGADTDMTPDPRDIESVNNLKTPSIEVRNLWKKFPAEKSRGRIVRAVRGLCLDVYEGEITCLIGPNGAGKSTFLSMLMGLMRPDKGSIHVFNLVYFILLIPVYNTCTYIQYSPYEKLKGLCLYK